MKAGLPLLALSLALAACAPATKAPPKPVARAPAPVVRPAPPRPAPAPVIQAPVSDNWMDATLTPGSWSYENRGNLTIAAFTGPTSGTALAIHCWRPNQTIALIMAGQSGPNPAITIRTETATRTVAARLEIGEFANVIGSLRGDDPLLDAMALSKGQFAVEADGLQPLHLPSHAEVSRVIEDCR
jgi:hypothetical protein